MFLFSIYDRDIVAFVSGRCSKRNHFRERNGQSEILAALRTETKYKSLDKNKFCWYEAYIGRRNDTDAHDLT